VAGWRLQPERINFIYRNYSVEVMTQWAILSGIQGNLAAYEAVLADIKRQRNLVEEIYILGDVVGLTPDSEKLVQRLRSPHRNEIKPMICKGWWEEQCLILHSLGATSEPVDLMRKYGANAVKLLWDSVSRPTVEWIRNLDFGFFLHEQS
jgi:hypothetical protein